MTPDDVLRLFPERGLAQSLHVAVWLGVIAQFALTESFGFVFTGLLVPGYLASMLVFRPYSALVTIVEAIVTFLIVRTLSERVSKSGALSPLFGRERFFAIIVVSVIVRQQMELWVLPQVAHELLERTHGAVDVQGDLFGIGLVAVALMANHFWKLDVPRGLLHAAVPTLFVFAVLHFVLLPYTNLSYANLQLTYEDASLDFLENPKVYILLVVGALLGTLFNLRFGWDYNGILTPALLAFTWMTPHRALATFVEAIVLVLVTRLFLAIPGVGTRNFQGPRALVLVFTIGLVLKWGLSWTLSDASTDLQASDLFGFGYLLPSLLAAKALQKKTIARVIFPSIVTSLAAFAIGSGVGFGFELVLPRPVVEQPRALDVATPTRSLLVSVEGVAGAQRVRALRRSPRAQDTAPAGIVSVGSRVNDWLASGAKTPPGAVVEAANEVGLAVVKLAHSPDARTWWVLIEREERLEEQRGLPALFVVPGGQGPVLVVPNPATAAPAADYAISACVVSDCRAIVLAGVDFDREAPTTPTLDGGAIADVDRAFRDVIARLRVAPIVEVSTTAQLTSDRAVLHVKGVLSDALALRALWPARMTLAWTPPADGSPSWIALDEVAVLRVPRIHATSVVVQGAAPPVVDDRSLTGWLGARAIASAGVDAHPYQAPSPTEVRFLHEVIAAPLLAEDGTNVVFDRLRLAWSARAARLVGLELFVLPRCAGGAQGCVVVAERDTPGRLGWGTLIVRAQGTLELPAATGVPEGPAARAVEPVAVEPVAVDPLHPVVLEVPHPRRESGLWRLAAQQFVGGNERALLLGGDGDPPAADVDPDPSRPGNFQTAFQAFHEAARRSVAGRADALVLQLRGFGRGRAVAAGGDVVLGIGVPLLSSAQVPGALRTLQARAPLVDAFLSRARPADGSAAVGGLHGAGLPQLEECDAFGGVACAVVWLSDQVRTPWFGRTKDGYVRKLAQLDIALVDASPAALLLEPALSRTVGPVPSSLAARFDALLGLADRAVALDDARLMAALRAQAGRSRGARVVFGFSAERGAPWVFVELRQGEHAVRAWRLLSPEPRIAVGNVDDGADVGRLELSPDEQRVRDEVEQGLLARATTIVVRGRVAPIDADRGVTPPPRGER